MKAYYLSLILILTTYGCGDQEINIELDKQQTPQRIVIKALITTDPNLCYVVISKTSDEYTAGSVEYVDDASVQLTENGGEPIRFNPVKEKRTTLLGDSATLYRYVPENRSFAGKIGKTYHLKVTVDGTLYEAQGTLLKVSPITKLEYEIVDADAFVPSYNIIAYSPDLNESKDYYKVNSLFINRYHIKLELDYVPVIHDEILNFENGAPIPGVYKKRDTVVVELYSIDQAVYKYYNNLNNVLDNDGGLFSSPAANPVSNISNEALGIFEVSDVSRDTIIIK